MLLPAPRRMGNCRDNGLTTNKSRKVWRVCQEFQIVVLQVLPLSIPATSFQVMALNANYQAFLSRPDVKALAADASIHYIPTLTTITGPAAIVKHLAAQQKQVKKKHEKLLHTIEGCDSLCLETETSFQFLSGGGCLLPQLDDNFVADKLATLPLVRSLSCNVQALYR